MIGSLEAYLALAGPDGPAVRVPLQETGPASATRRAGSSSGGESTTATRRQTHRPRQNGGGNHDGEPDRHGRDRRAGRRARGLGEGIMQRSIRTASARAETLAGAMGHRPGHLGRPGLSRLREEPHLIPLEQNTKNAIIGMEKLSEVLGKIRAQCKED